MNKSSLLSFHKTKLEPVEKLGKMNSMLHCHRLELEKAILGVVMLENHALPEIIDLLSIRSFSREHQTIWQTILQLHKQGQPIDIKTVTHQALKLSPSQGEMAEGQRGTNLPYLISSCTTYVNSAANIRTHAIMLVELGITEQFLHIYTSTQMDNYSIAMAEDVLAALHTDQDKLQTIDQATSWFQRTLPDAEITKKLTNLQKAVLTKVAAIRESERMRTAILQLEHFTSHRQHRPEVRELAEVLLQAINTPKLPPAFTQQVYHLRKSLTK